MRFVVVFECVFCILVVVCDVKVLDRRRRDDGMRRIGFYYGGVVLAVVVLLGRRKKRGESSRWKGDGNPFLCSTEEAKM